MGSTAGENQARVGSQQELLVAGFGSVRQIGRELRPIGLDLLLELMKARVDRAGAAHGALQVIDGSPEAARPGARDISLGGDRVGNLVDLGGDLMAQVGDLRSGAVDRRMFIAIAIGGVAGLAQQQGFLLAQNLDQGRGEYLGSGFGLAAAACDVAQAARTCFALRELGK